MVLLALDWDEAKIAGAIGITRPTLRKHYFRELKIRDEARARLEGAAVVAQAAKAAAGDTQAFRELFRLFAQADLRALEPFPQRPGKVEKLGVKEQRQRAAASVGGHLAPGPPPKTTH